mmetsp:Transcript_98817/g.176002  ORF Transcript_98817/g.176002 Transcript_98817/m.176002 type:complete len:842 (-) Transcript_98817:152-2677(-)
MFSSGIHRPEVVALDGDRPRRRSRLSLAAEQTEPPRRRAPRSRSAAREEASPSPAGASRGSQRRQESKAPASSSRRSRKDSARPLPEVHAGAAGRASREGVRHQKDWADLEENWQAYLQSDEFQTFHAVVDLLNSLPPGGSQLSERRADFELLVHLLHRLGLALNVEHQSKSYRAHYSPDVQLTGYLYSTLLTAFTLLPTYVLNGQEFYVSDTVLDQCQSLQDVFLETCKELKRQYENLQPYSLEQIRNDVKRSLVYFDRSWCRFEMPALEEIEAIHRQACRPLIEAIEVEKSLSEFEGKKNAVKRTSIGPGAQRMRLDVQRSRFLEKICELNRLANVDGKGRSDMDLTCVIEAEKIAARPICTRAVAEATGAGKMAPEEGEIVHQRCCGGACASPVLLRIARSLLRTFDRLRRVLRRHGRCLYQLNSHLANNPDLVRALELFESAWETAARYLVQAAPRKLALLTYEVISSIREPRFQSALVSLDPGFLVATLPRVLLFFQMLRATRIDSGAIATTAQAATAVKKAIKAQDEVSSSGKTLPRPALDGSLRKPPPISALQRSPLAKAFLPADVVGSFDEAVALLSRFSEARSNRLRDSLLIPVGSSNGCTPVTRSAAGPLSELSSPLGPRLTLTGNGRKPGTGRIGTGRCGTGRCSTGRQERPPATPCPPRMAVPNSRPATSKDPPGPVLSSPNLVSTEQETPLKESAEESDDDEDEDDDVFCIDLATLREVEAGLEAAAVVEKTPAEPAATDTESPEVAIATTPNMGPGSAGDEEERQVVALISMLALRLQREKAQEWNELIQVVIQGLMLARGPTPSGHGRKNTAERVEEVEEEKSLLS